MSPASAPASPPARPGLRRDVLLSLGILMLGAVTVLGAAALAASERMLLAQRQSSMSQTALAIGQALAASCVPGRGRTGQDALGDTVQRLARELPLDALVVADGQGRILASYREESRGSLSSDPALGRALAAGRLVTQEEAGGRPPDLSRSWTFAAPLPPGAGPAAVFSASFPVEDLRAALGAQRAGVLAFALLDVAIILVFGNFLLGGVAIRPLQGLARAARALAEGQRGARAPVAGSREVASLAEYFNEMAARVEESALRQEEHLSSLTRAHCELRAAQEELVRAEKLASVGRLASGVAHEIGNPLAAVIGYAHLLLRGRPEGEEAEYLRHIESETERIRRIISDLLEFSRPREAAMEEDLAVNQVVSSALDLVRPQGEFREVALVFSPGEGLPPVRGDRHQLRQMMVNLFLNAAAAMEGRGELSVSTSLCILAEGEVPPRRRRATDRPGPLHPPAREEGAAGTSSPAAPLAPGSRVVRIRVRDTGPGVPPGLAGRIFEPFFTTKPPGQGTGLGLALAWGIVAAHRGLIRLAAPAGEEGGGEGKRGAEFVIDLPVEG